jgi:hypothetical protein
VNVNRNDNDWNDNWWFAGVRNSLHAPAVIPWERCFPTVFATRRAFCRFRRYATQLGFGTVIRKLNQGIDFLGYTIFPHHRLVRTKTRQRIFRKLRQKVLKYRLNQLDTVKLDQSLQSYRGVLSHADSYELQECMENQVLFWQSEA